MSEVIILRGIPDQLVTKVDELVEQYIKEHFSKCEILWYHAQIRHSRIVCGESYLIFQIVVYVEGLDKQISSDCYVSSSGKNNYCGKPADFSVPVKTQSDTKGFTTSEVPKAPD